MTRKTFVALGLSLLFSAFAAFAAFAAAEIPVTVRPLGDLLVTREYNAPASVVPANRTLLTSQITALIDELTVDVGQVVAEGDVLVRLDPANTQLAVAGAEAQVASLQAQIQDARRRLARAEELVGRDFVSDDEVNARRTEVEVLEADLQRQRVALRNARLDLRRTTVAAPFNAAVVERQGQVGSLATPGTLLLTLVQLDNREVDAEIDPRHAQRVMETAEFSFVSDGQEWPLELARLSPVIDMDSRKLRGRFRFRSHPAAVGSAGQVLWSEASRLLPVELIVQRQSQLGFFSISDGQARFIPLPSAQEGRPAAVDLPDGTPVVTRGHVRLQHGDAVQIAGE